MLRFVIYCKERQSMGEADARVNGSGVLYGSGKGGLRAAGEDLGVSGLLSSPVPPREISF